MADNEWAPKTREDWTELFADGFLRARSKHDEDEAKKNAASPPGETGDGSGDKKPKTFAERLLGA